MENQTNNTPAATAPAPVAAVTAPNKISTKAIIGFVVSLLVVATVAFAIGYGWKKGQEVAA